MKRSVCILFLVLLLFSSVSTLGFVSSADDLGIGDRAGQFEQGVENVESNVKGITDTSKWNEKWDYLAKEWKAMLLKNPIIKTADSFFTSISKVFKFVFGVPYSMSLVLFGIIFLWLVFLLEMGRIFSVFEKTQDFAYLISAVLAVILANLKVFEYLSLLIGRFIFSSESIFGRFISLCLVIGGVFLLSYLVGFIVKLIKKDIKKQKKEEDDLDRWTFKKFLEGYRKRI